MTAFARGVTAPTPVIISDALGTGSDVYHSPSDIGKALSLGAASHALAMAGSDIDGFLHSVEPFTVNDGYSFGGIKIAGQQQAVVGANQGGTAMAVGDYVVADTQLALGTAGSNQQWTNYPGTAPSTPTGPTAQVRTGSPARKFWRCIRIISGTGAAGSVVLLERL